jgi:hypothetical protein
MRKKELFAMRGAVCRLVLLSLLIVVGATRNTAAQATCDRACLTGVADAWFAALVAHDPSKAPIAGSDFLR